MRVVNRNAIVLKPKAPLVEWINEVNPQKQVTLEEICADYSCYLIPEVLSRREQKEYLEQNFAQLFKVELEAWQKDRTTWPRVMSFRIFLEWFEVTFHSTVYDHAGDQIWESPAR